MSNPTIRMKSVRSPSYSLKKAVECARKLKDKEGKNYTPVDVAKAHWGYTPKSGSGLRAEATMKLFGLVDVQGKGASRKIRISKTALIILDSPNAEDRKGALQTAAKNPPVYGELYEKHHADMPSPESLKWELTGEGDASAAKLTDQAADRFIALFFDTLAYSGLDDGSIDTAESENEPPPEYEPHTEQDDASGIEPTTGRFDGIFGRSSSKQGPENGLRLPLPAGEGIVGSIVIPDALTQTQWETFQQSLNTTLEYLSKMMVIDDPPVAEEEEED